MLSFIDVMRGIAILMVIANHVAFSVNGMSAPLDMASKFGQMGVQLFFVASAYTLCLSWQRAHDVSDSPWRFYVRRVFRIAPLYYFGIALFAAIHYLESDAPGHPTSAVLANMAFVHGFVPHANNGVVPGGWSIGTEMAFYALFPLLMGLYERIPPSQRGLGMLKLCALALAFNLIVQAFTFPAMDLRITNNSFAYFNLVNQLPVFLLGMAMYAQVEGAQASDAPPAVPRRHRYLALIALLFGFLLSAWLWRSTLPIAFALVPTLSGLAFCGLLFLLRSHNCAWPWMVSIGQHSYSMYIVHIVFAWHGARWLQGHLPSSWSPDWRFVLLLAASVLLSWLAAHVLARLIEAPGIALGRQLIRSLNMPGRTSKAL